MKLPGLEHYIHPCKISITEKEQSLWTVKIATPSKQNAEMYRVLIKITKLLFFEYFVLNLINPGAFNFLYVRYDND